MLEHAHVIDLEDVLPGPDLIQGWGSVDGALVYALFSPPNYRRAERERFLLKPEDDPPQPELGILKSTLCFVFHSLEIQN